MSSASSYLAHLATLLLLFLLSVSFAMFQLLDVTFMATMFSFWIVGPHDSDNVVGIGIPKTLLCQLTQILVK